MILVGELAPRDRPVRLDPRIAAERPFAAGRGQDAADAADRRFVTLRRGQEDPVLLGGILRRLVRILVSVVGVGMDRVRSDRPQALVAVSRLPVLVRRRRLVHERLAAVLLGDVSTLERRHPLPVRPRKC